MAAQLLLSGDLPPHEYDPKLKKLTIRNAERFPEQLFAVGDQIEILDMSYGKLRTLPDGFGRLHKLKTVFLSYNEFEELPEVLGSCPALVMIGLKSCRIARISERALPPGLRGLTLTDNKITALPAGIGRLANLQKLMVAGNLLTDLPRELLDCQNLEGVRIAANQLTDAPDWLLGLPRLAWYSDAGNPFCDTRRADNNAALPSIPWSDLDIGTKLGESAKNVVHKGVIRSTGQEVAVKIYGGELTTDGYPIDEMRANIAAGRHEHLIDILGIVTGAPAGQQALVMQLVASDYSAPGQPPSLETFTRDVYPPDTSFSLSVATEILHGVASALQHLHRRGVMHGDVYAHNLLANPEGRCVVGDLGGASLYDVSAGPAREYIDVLAFGVLMDELLMRCKEQGLTIAALRDLQQRCLHEKAAARPLFTGILDSLAVARNV